MSWSTHRHARPRPGAAIGSAGLNFLLVLLATLTLTAIGAAWKAWDTAETLRAAQMLLNSNAPDPEILKMQAQIAELHSKLGEVAMLLEGPIGHVANSYPSEMEELRARIAELERRIAATPESAGPTRRGTAGRAEDAAQTTGDWVVHLSSSETKGLARRDVERARSAGLVAQITEWKKDGRVWYRVTVKRSFASAQEARAYLRSTAAAAGFSSAWIAKR